MQRLLIKISFNAIMSSTPHNNIRYVCASNYAQMTCPFVSAQDKPTHTYPSNTALNNFAYAALNLYLFVSLCSLIMAKS
jgi:hypothetical protein